MLELRVTKYNPAFRDGTGAYTRDEWTSVADIGCSDSGVTLSDEQYQQVENAYASTAVAFMRETGIESLAVTGLENYAAKPLPFAEASVLTLEEVEAVVRQVLREEYWCRLEARGGFVHIGYDYYMYVGVSRVCPEAQQRAERLGLFVESFLSPYRERDGP